MTPDLRPGTVLYRATCPRCRWLSLVVVLVTAGRIRRVPLDAPEVRALYDACAECRGRPALWDGRLLTTGAEARRRALRLALGRPPVRAAGSRGFGWVRGPR